MTRRRSSVLDSLRLPKNSVPNFDGMTIAELRRFQLRYERPTERQAAHLVGRRPHLHEDLELTKQLANYARLKANAMKLRLVGEIENAVAHERMADAVYNQLPDDLKW